MFQQIWSIARTLTKNIQEMILYYTRNGLQYTEITWSILVLKQIFASKSRYPECLMDKYLDYQATPTHTTPT